jgi:hypothetical protein
VPVGLAESFVDRPRFSGASYRAANGQAMGWTRGFAKRQSRFVHHAWKPRLPSQCELSVEDVETVVGELKEFTGLFGPTFGRSEPEALFELYLQGLLSDAERKNVEAIALKLDGPERVRNLQRFMKDSPWDEPWMPTE